MSDENPAAPSAWLLRQTAAELDQATRHTPVAAGRTGMLAGEAAPIAPRWLA